MSIIRLTALLLVLLATPPSHRQLTEAPMARAEFVASTAEAEGLLLMPSSSSSSSSGGFSSGGDEVAPAAASAPLLDSLQLPSSLEHWNIGLASTAAVLGLCAVALLCIKRAVRRSRGRWRLPWCRLQR